MKKNKKLLLALGTIATVAAPVAAVVSCGSGSGTTGSSTAPGLDAQDVTSKINNYVSGGSVTNYLPTNSDKWYSPIIGDRKQDEAGNGITPFGLFSGVNQATYDFGTLENSISYNIGYLQNGKLMMISYYKAHPESSADANDPRASLTRLGTVLNATVQKYFKDKASDFLSDAGDANGKSTVNDDVKAVQSVLEKFDVANVIKSSAANLSNLDYKGLDGLAQVFSQDKYINAKDGSDEDKLGKAVMKHIGGAFNRFGWDLHKDVNTHTVAENTKLFYAYDEVMGYSWDAFVGVLGDRKTPSASLIAPGVSETAAVDHNNLIGNWKIGDKYNKDLKTFEPATKSTGPYSSQLYRMAGDVFTESGALYAEASNETLSQGIIAYDKGTPRYGSDGSIVSGTQASVRYLKFGLFDSITLIDKSNKKTVFNSDSETATDALSINGNAFKAAITAGVSSITAHVRANQKYVKGGTGATSAHTVKAEDFWTYIQNLSYGTVGQRNKVETFGGKELASEEGKEPRNSVAKAFEDQISKSTINKTDTWAAPSKQEASSNPFFWDAIETQYGVDAIKDTDADKKAFLKEQDSITFNFKDNADESATQLLWNNLFANPGVENLHALPTENLKEKSEAFVDKITLPEGVTKDDVINSKGVQYGVYYDYAAESVNDFEYAGRYYVKENGNSRIVWAKNTKYGGFWDNEDSAPNSYSNEYIDQSNAYGAVYKQSYENGEIFTAPIADPKLKSWHDDLIALPVAEAQAKGVTYVKAHTSAGDVGERFQTLALPFGTKDPSNGKYYFNDNFAKVLYGDTISKIWKATSLEGLAETLYHGTGLEFRSSLQAGINPYSLAHNDTPGIQGPLSTYGPEAAIPGNDAKADPLLVSETKIFGRAAFGKHFVEVSDQDYRDIYTQNSGSAVYTVADAIDRTSGGTTTTDHVNYLKNIKENIEDALTKAGVTEGQLISELPLDYKSGLNTLNTANSLQNYLEALNSFNVKINFVAIVNPVQLIQPFIATKIADAIVVTKTKN